jgi:hypothetical protein
MASDDSQVDFPWLKSIENRQSLRHSSHAPCLMPAEE